MCGMKDSLRSKITPRNLVSSTTGMGVPFSSRVGYGWGLRNLQKCMHTVLEGENLNPLVSAQSADDCDIVRSIKQRMRAALDKRLPVTELHAIAAIMDPSQRNLITLQDYLTQRGTTAVDLLTEAIQKYVGVADSSTTSSEFENQEVVDSASSRPWKRAKLELLSKHAGSAPSRAQEIQQFRCLSVSPDDVMTWWESQQNTYPNISKLARALLAIPATSVPSERIFSLTGLAINAKRSGPLPSSVDKMIFVHENVHLTL